MTEAVIIGVLLLAVAVAVVAAYVQALDAAKGREAALLAKLAAAGEANEKAKAEAEALRTLVDTLKKELTTLEADLAAHATPDAVRDRLRGLLYAPTGGPLVANERLPDEPAAK